MKSLLTCDSLSCCGASTFSSFELAFVLCNPPQLGRSRTRSRSVDVITLPQKIVRIVRASHNLYTCVCVYMATWPFWSNLFFSGNGLLCFCTATSSHVGFTKSLFCHSYKNNWHGHKQIKWTGPMREGSSRLHYSGARQLRRGGDWRNICVFVTYKFGIM